MDSAGKITLTGDVTVMFRRGLHMQVAGALVGLVNGYSSQVKIAKGRIVADARSMLDLVSLSAAPGSRLHLTVTGEDAESAMKAVKDFFAEKPE